MLDIGYINLLLIAAVLVLASYQDLKTREIDDRIWLYAAPVGAVLTVVEYFTTPGYPLLLALFSVGLTVALAFGIFYAGLYGGADAKALIFIAVTMPVYLFASTTLSPFYPLTILGNGLALSLLLIPTLLVVNLVWKVRRGSLFDGISATTGQKVLALFTGMKVKPSTAMSINFNLIEKVGKGEEGEEREERRRKGERYLKLFNTVEDTDEVKVIPKGAEYVWVTPAIPMIVFFLIGYVLALVGVDIIVKTVLFFLQGS